MILIRHTMLALNTKCISCHVQLPYSDVRKANDDCAESSHANLALSQNDDTPLTDRVLGDARFHACLVSLVNV